MLLSSSFPCQISTFFDCNKYQKVSATTSTQKEGYNFEESRKSSYKQTKLLSIRCKEVRKPFCLGPHQQDTEENELSFKDYLLAMPTVQRRLERSEVPSMNDRERNEGIAIKKNAVYNSRRKRYCFRIPHGVGVRPRCGRPPHDVLSSRHTSGTTRCPRCPILGPSGSAVYFGELPARLSGPNL
jgi:hypothetical protein